MQKSWNTYYIYYGGSADQILKEIVHPSIEDVQQSMEKELKFFFIRYFENGYHIRLRLFLSAKESILFKSMLANHVSVYEHINKAAIVVRETEYIPEIGRYGNADTIKYAESYFYESSRFVLHHLVTKEPLTISERYLLALKTHMIFLKGMGFSKNYSQQLCDKFIQSWLPVPFSQDSNEYEQNRKSIRSAFQIQFETYQDLLCEPLAEFWNSLDTTTDVFIKQFLEANGKIWSKYNQAQLSSNALEEVLLSFIHMTNNRLGIVNSEESYLLFLIMKTIPLIKDYDNKQRT
ncbi:hypothetical protein CEY12_06445 [Chryseobacterium sp. T16E-39]|uniref:thiopeptide-type bacteriocin biosynthesis protein n=1 Tax=Chryseobacterium sp. T16E-39 TaxID=2015076 RepID=UPI000B5B25F3|nr:thiopeptide-type bacteriocin biosynthesis protein [Chryseobacterium sp. T16E-39]ASK29767.1 hypothetical protein CEY12_06445 [Chryseobacterium sp. T16E-39]